MSKELIRNFSIIAHIDHGKSTLADRLLQYTGAVEPREFREQILDDMDLERERGITIKASAVRINYSADDGKRYTLNLIDTPGHVDFSYEVSKALSACEGAILVVDAAQGVEAQTVANLCLAEENGLEIISVINKIDLGTAEPERVREQLLHILDAEEPPIVMASAKQGTGTKQILETIVKLIPPPGGSRDAPLQALIFDSEFDPYRGIVIYLRVVNGVIIPGSTIRMMATDKNYEVQELGVFTPKPVQVESLSCGEVGFCVCNIKDIGSVKIGDTVTDFKRPAASSLPGYRQVQPMVFCGIYPVNSKDFVLLKEAIRKLSLSDASFVHNEEESSGLGFGFRCGFLGLLHMEIIQERLEREYDLNLLITTPSVAYRVETIEGKSIEVDNPVNFPVPQKIAVVKEPYIKAFIITPAAAVGSIMKLSQSARGRFKTTEYLDETRVKLTYEFPLCEVIVDFYDKIKSITSGYGSLDYEFLDYWPTRLSKLDVLVNGQNCDALSCLVHQDKLQQKGRALVEKLKGLIPRQLFEVVVQAAVGSRIIARASIRPLGKHVTSKCYGGDITRKRKLWEKQKAGKKRMKQFGKVQIPQEAFLAALRI